MIKAILFDVDGVVFKPRDKYFSQRLREDGSSVPEEKINSFFKNEYKKIVIGKADLREEVEKYLDDWNWNGSVEELLNYWFSYENKIDQEVVDLVQELREKGVKCYLASDHSKYRTDDFMNNVGLKKYFDGVFSSGYLGYTKEEKEFFAAVIKDLGLPKNEILFVDDDPENVRVAESVGINAVHFDNKKNLINSLRIKILNE